MASTRRILTNWSKGELSPRLDGRPDLAVYTEGAKTLENWLLIRQGGVTRRPGLRFVREVKRSDKDTVLLPFEFSVDDAFVIEAGETYMRFYRDRKNLLAFSGGPPVEVVSPYAETDLRSLHFTQAADVVYLFNPNFIQRRLSRISDTNWSLNPIIYKPPPSFETDVDISAGATLTPAAVSGTSVLFTASGAVFLQGDVGRLIIFGASRATITGFGASAGDVTSPNTKVRADILDAFPNTNPGPGPDVLTGWKLRLSPQTTLDANKKEPVGAQVTMVAGTPAFRAADVGKFIVLYGGLIKITLFDSVTQVRGELLSVLSTSLTDPAASPAGAWTLEEASWSGTNGFPRTGEFVQGRLVQASTKAQPTTWWMSASDDFDNYAIGVTADTALEFTITKKRVNRIDWIADHFSMFIGTAGSEFIVESGKADTPFGGDVVPSVKSTSYEGGAPVQPSILNRQLIFLDRSRKKIFTLLFDIYTSNYQASEITGAAEHITGTGIKLGPMAFTTRPDPRIYFVREDGQLIALTFFVEEKVIGFTRIVTKGTFESVAVIPQPGGGPDLVWVIVRRTVSGQTRRYVEFFENEATDSIAGPDTMLESTGNGQSWLIGALIQSGSPIGNSEWNANRVNPVFISDTTVLRFFRGATIRNSPFYKISLDGGVTFSDTEQALTPEAVGDAMSDMLSAESVVDPADLPPERRVFILLESTKVWVSRNVLQPNPTLATWSKVTLTGTGIIAANTMGVRVNQVCVQAVNNDGPPHLSLHCSNDFGVTFPNNVLISPLVTSTAGIGNQFVVSPGTDIWVVLNIASGSGFIYRTINNGVSWTLVIELVGSGVINRGCLLNLDDTIMVAIVGSTVFRSTDAGLTWVEVTTIPGSSIIAIGYFGNGIIGGFVEATIDAAAGGSIEMRSEDYGLTWAAVPVDAGFDFAATHSLSKMAVRGPRAVVVGSSFSANVRHWYCPSTVISVGPGDNINFADRPWNSLETDSAVVYISAIPTKIVPGLSHLEGETVEVVADGAFRGTFVVNMGSVTINEEAQRFEVGLHYSSIGVTMRPSVTGQVIEGLPLSWVSLFARLQNTVGGRVNGKHITYPPSPVSTLAPFTGDRKVTGMGVNETEGRITFEQTEPYPMTVLALFGTLNVGDHD